MEELQILGEPSNRYKICPFCEEKMFEKDFFSTFHFEKAQSCVSCRYERQKARRAEAEDKTTLQAPKEEDKPEQKPAFQAQTEPKKQYKPEIKEETKEFDDEQKLLVDQSKCANCKNIQNINPDDNEIPKFYCSQIDNFISIDAIKRIRPCEFFKFSKDNDFQHCNNKTPLIKLPSEGKSTEGRTIGQFAEELGKVLSETNEIFFKPEVRSVVEIRRFIEKNKESNNTNEYLGFGELTPNRLITLGEKHAWLYKKVIKKDEEGEAKGVNVEKNMNINHANITLVSDQFIEKLPSIRRIFTIPQPILYHKTITLPKEGYDPRFQSWLNPSEIKIEEITEEQAHAIINEIFEEFAFQKDEEGNLTEEGKQSRTHAIAALFTPFLRGLYPEWNCRTPLFFYLGNRPGVGKDYCAGITSIVYEGSIVEEPAISTTDKNQNSNDELRKKILSAALRGRRRLHFSNNKGHLNSAILEGTLTNKTLSDRILGKNDIIQCDNEMEFSMSGNVGITWDEDLERRTRFITLFLDIEKTNERKFKNPNLHEWVTEKRNKILSALYTFVKKWEKEGMKPGITPFASFPEWASICGGIMVQNELGDPCMRSVSEMANEGDSETINMKKLYELLFDEFGETPFTKRDIYEKMVNGADGEPGWQEKYVLFQYINFEEKTDKVKFAKIFKKNINRIYSDLKLRMVSKVTNTTREQYILKAVGMKKEKKQLNQFSEEKIEGYE